MAVRAVIFDLDGTLLDSVPTIAAAYVRTIESLGGSATREQVVDAFALGPPPAVLAEILGRPTTTEDVARYHGNVETIAGDIEPYPGVREALEALEKRVPLGIFTGASLAAARILLEAAGLRELFRAVVGGDEVDHPKPAPDGVLLACERLERKPSEAAFVGDTAGDMRAARAAGAVAVAAGWSNPGLEGANLVLRKPEELLSLV